jgi:leucyl aminopeptidase
MQALPEINFDKSVIGVFCLAENSFGPSSYHVSSILTSYKGEIFLIILIK